MKWGDLVDPPSLKLLRTSVLGMGKQRLEI